MTVKWGKSVYVDHAEEATLFRNGTPVARVVHHDDTRQPHRHIAEVFGTGGDVAYSAPYRTDAAARAAVLRRVSRG